MDNGNFHNIFYKINNTNSPSLNSNDANNSNSTFIINNPYNQIISPKDYFKINEFSSFFFDNKNITSLSKSNYNIENKINFLDSYDQNNFRMSSNDIARTNFNINILNNNNTNNFIFFNTNNSKYFCKICNRNYTKKDNLQRHIRAQQLNFEGKLCPYCNIKKKRLREHIKRIHSIKSCNTSINKRVKLKSLIILEIFLY